MRVYVSQYSLFAFAWRPGLLRGRGRAGSSHTLSLLSPMAWSTLTTRAFSIHPKSHMVSMTIQSFRASLVLFKILRQFNLYNHWQTWVNTMRAFCIRFLGKFLGTLSSIKDIADQLRSGEAITYFIYSSFHRVTNFPTRWSNACDFY